MPLEDLSHAELLRLRASTDDPEMQQFLAPYEHQAFAREYAQENPIRAIGLLASIPGYQAAKAAGLIGSQTGTGGFGAQMAAGYKGLAQGYGSLLSLGAKGTPVPDSLRSRPLPVAPLEVPAPNEPLYKTPTKARAPSTAVPDFLSSHPLPVAPPE